MLGLVAFGYVLLFAPDDATRRGRGAPWDMTPRAFRASLVEQVLVGRLRHAAQSGRTYLEKRPTDLVTARMVAGLWETCGQPWEARAAWAGVLDQADTHLESDPEDPDALWHRALALVHLGRRPEAAPLLDRLSATLENEPVMPKVASYRQAAVQAAQGRLGPAGTHLIDLLEANAELAPWILLDSTLTEARRRPEVLAALDDAAASSEVFRRTFARADRVGAQLRRLISGGRPDIAMLVARGAELGSFPIGRRYEALMFRAILLEDFGLPERAQAVWERLHGELSALPGAGEPGWVLAPNYAWSLQGLGRRREARAHWAAIADAHDPSIPSTAGSPAPELGAPTATQEYNLACFRALAGQPERAIAHFEQAARLGFHDPAWAAHDFDLESIRDDPRFQAALALMRGTGD